MNIQLIPISKTKINYTSLCKSKNYDSRISFSGGEDSFVTNSVSGWINNSYLQKAISPEVKRKILPFIKAAQETGKDIFIFGGFVRELLKGKPYNDIDLVVSGNTQDFFKKFLKTNKNEDTKYAVSNYKRPDMQQFQKIKLKHNGHDFDINPLGIWQKNGHLEEALIGRAKSCDFTICSMMIQASLDKSGEMKFKFIDPLNGYSDMKQGILRLADKDGKLFNENPERIIQALRLRSRYKMTIDDTLQAEINKYVENQTAQKDKVYYIRMRRALKGLLKDNNSVIKTFRDIFTYKLYKLF